MVMLRMKTMAYVTLTRVFEGLSGVGADEEQWVIAWVDVPGTVMPFLFSYDGLLESLKQKLPHRSNWTPW
jgi:hypothetical protein